MTHSRRRTRPRKEFVLIGLVVLAGCRAEAADERLVNGFESEAELAQWEITAGGTRLVTEGATQGRLALELTFNPGGQWDAAHLFWNRVVADWTPYDALVLDVFNPLDRPIVGSLLVADRAWEQGGRSYWNRHNSEATFPPGAGRWVVPVRGLYRGEAGSRNNDIKRDIDPDSIVRLDFGFGRPGESGRIIIDNLRFVKVDRPAGVRAFDFGPPSQPVMLGWTGVSHQSAYDPQVGYGWFPANACPWNGAARDTTFGPMLTQDFCEAGGYRFRIDVPPGEYDVLVIYENAGYWGGEQARCAERRISANGQTVWSEVRPDGRSTALYRFEDVEPVGVDLWDTYMAPEITRPVRFSTTAGNEGVVLGFEADVVWGSKLSALALWRSDDAAAAAWIDEQLQAVAAEFRAKAVCLDPPAPEFTPPAGWAGRRLVAWPSRIEDTITPRSVPATAPAPDELALSAQVVRGEFEPLCLALRPTVDLGDCRIVLQPGDGWPASTLSVVRYGLRRGFGSLAWRTEPYVLRPAEALALSAGVTRQIVITAHVPEDAPAGVFTARLRVESGAETLLDAPLSLTIHPVTLDRETDYLMGFFGLEPPESLLPDGAAGPLLAETLRLLREHGMNAVSGGPSWRLTGWRNGEPQLDFGDCDAFFELLAEHGFTRPINGYGGLRFVGLHDGYQRGASAAKVAEESGLPYETAFARAWEAVDRHARAHGWPTIYYAMCDETRVRDVAERELEFMKLMAQVSAKFPATVRTSGSYSVDFRSRPTDENDLKLWHQRFFEALDVSSLNGHDDTVMAEAQRLGKEIHIYNQGTSRYSFGLYQWSEYQKGVRARWQWHLNVLHGYQFFDLDGREPDTAMLVYGRGGIYPTIDFERCREGAEDFYLYQTLARAVAANEQANRKPAETRRAQEWLTALTAGVAINQRRPPEGYDADALKRQAIALLESVSP